VLAQRFVRAADAGHRRRPARPRDVRRLS
jgi:hypothetical protein